MSGESLQLDKSRKYLRIHGVYAPNPKAYWIQDNEIFSRSGEHLGNNLELCGIEPDFIEEFNSDSETSKVEHSNVKDVKTEVESSAPTLPIKSSAPTMDERLETLQDELMILKMSHRQTPTTDLENQIKAKQAEIDVLIT